MRRRHPALLALLLAAIVVAAAAIPSSASRTSPNAPAKKHAKISVILVAGITTDAFYLTMKKGAAAEAKALGADFSFTGSPAAFSPPTQIPFLNAAIARHPSVIMIAPTDVNALAAPIQRAISAGIPVETVDTHLNKPLAFTNVSTDNPGGGALAAKALVQAIGGSGEVAIMSTTPGVSTVDERVAGFTAELKKHSDVTYLGLQYCNDDTPTAARLTSALLAAHPNLKGVFAVNVKSGDGVTSAVTSAGKAGAVKLVEFDAGPPQVAALRAGTIDALIAQYPYGIGKLGVQLAVKWAKGQKTGIKKHYGTGSAVVTQANVNTPAIKKYLYTP
ncbi:MAG TPA: ABC transporter substrate-binding protein [Gaiellaceae bacterium]|jgi:ribose transport system substrate-binding protein|nr:ABC transporter substrate-binding protein [Gaiellaceae bacterium]